MSVSNSFLVGSPLPIICVTYDGAANQYPQAEIRDNDDVLVTILDLIHVASGEYRPASPYSMPNKAWLNILCIVYSDIGHTIKNRKYSQDTDLFCKAITGEYDSVFANIPTITEFNDRTLLAADYFDPTTDEVTTDAASCVASQATGFATLNPPSQNLEDYKVNVDLLALESTSQNIKTKTDLLKDSWNDPSIGDVANAVLDEIA